MEGGCLIFLEKNGATDSKRPGARQPKRNEPAHTHTHTHCRLVNNQQEVMVETVFQLTNIHTGRREDGHER